MKSRATNMNKWIGPCILGLVAALMVHGPASAHGPLFSPAPETIWKDGTEITLGSHFDKATGGSKKEREVETFLEVEYGLTADWQIGIEVPYSWKEDDGARSNGPGDVTLSTKVQFWQRDLPGAQYKGAAFLEVKLPTGNDDSDPRLGSGSTDVIMGLATGYESRRWYWFASGVYRANTEGSGNLEKGDRQFLNLVGGIRPVLSAYEEPDTVLMLELNWERSGPDRLDGVKVGDSGGWELFVSPVMWWTYRQYAVRAGVQIPVARSLQGSQATTDYRARLELIYHF